MKNSAEHILEAWSRALRPRTVTELVPGRVWAVTAAGGERYVLKKVSFTGGPDSVRRFGDEARVLTYLLQRGIQVAVPVPADAGAVCVSDGGADGAPYAVFPMPPDGREAGGEELDPVRFHNIGAAIARLHAALADCPFGVESWQVGPDLVETWSRMMREHLPPAARTELTAGVEPRLDALHQALSAPVQRIHGDVHGGNILTVGQEVTGIIDCDHLPLAPRGFDLGYFIAFAVHWYLDEHDEPAPPVDEAVPFITRHLVTGYDSVSRLSARENEDLPALALAAALGLIDYFIKDCDVIEESWLATARWIGDNYDALRPG